MNGSDIGYRCEMRRYWIEKNQIIGDEVQLSGDVFHHIIDVCRQNTGSVFELLTDEQKAYLVELVQVSKKIAIGKIKETRTIDPLPRPHIHLALSLSRFPVMDAVVEKAVEMGVSSIQPFFSEFSFVRSDEKISQNKIDRWDKIIRSATQQCGRGELMKMRPAITFQELKNKINQDADFNGLFAYEGLTTLGIKEKLNKIRSERQKISDFWIIVGSEGGFSHKEVDEMTALGLHPVTLGQQVLRVETACIALVSVLKYDFELMK